MKIPKGYHNFQNRMKHPIQIEPSQKSMQAIEKFAGPANCDLLQAKVVKKCESTSDN